MVRPLLEIEHPWLTRDEVEAAIWRLTETKNPYAVEQMLRLMDIYAVSQGPGLIQKLRARDQARRRWDMPLPASSPELKPELESEPEPEPAQLRLLQLAEDGDDSTEPDPGEPGQEPEPGFSGPVLIKEKPLKATDAWRLPDGRFIQLCSSCSIPKDYDEFHKDQKRWNSKASQCKKCKNGSKKQANRHRPGRQPREPWLVPGRPDLGEPGNLGKTG